MRFTFLTGDINWMQYGAKWVSKRLNNGEFDYWLVLEFLNWEEATGEKTPDTYYVSLSSVSPSEAGQENLGKAFECCGIPEESDIRSNPLVQVEALDSYGVKACIWQSNGPNAKRLLKKAHEQAEIASGLYGFYMDRPQNRIGTDGWEAQRGNIMAGLDRLAK